MTMRFEGFVFVNKLSRHSCPRKDKYYFVICNFNVFNTGQLFIADTKTKKMYTYITPLFEYNNIPKRLLELCD